MGLILSLETATRTCSVALGKNGQLLAYKDFHSEQYSHAEKLNTMIIDLLEEEGVDWNDIDAIAVSEGPGSYTGLRIGVSTAKGLCYARNLPLIAINSLASLANRAASNAHDYRCPMFDARRMEVYAAVYDQNNKEVKSTEPVIIDEFSFKDLLENGSVLFMGPGAEKCQDVIVHPNTNFDLTTNVSARGMVKLAEQNFQEKNFVDVAYFEPNYLKSFIAGQPKKLL